MAQNIGVLPGVELTANLPKGKPGVVPQINGPANGRVNSTGVVRTPNGYARIATADQLTSTQLQRLTNKADGYIANARLRGEEYAAQRGGLGGSIAAGAAERAAIEAAAPIAQANAQAEIGAASETMQSLANQLATKTRTDAQIQSATISANAQLRAQELSNANALARARLDNQTRRELTEMELANRLQLEEMGQEFRTNLQQMELDWRAMQNDKDRQIELQRLAQRDEQFREELRLRYGSMAAEVYTNYSNSYLSNIAEIISNPNLSPEQQRAGVAQVQELFNQQMIYFEPLINFFKDMQWPPDF